MISYTWTILCESAIYILFGFLIAGALQLVISATRVVQLLTGNRKRSVLYATIVGMPLPLCSCSVLPTALTLRRQGASKGATLSFLISTPETSVTSILLTYSLLGPLMAVFRPIAACITAIIAGLIENTIEKRAPSPPPQPETPAAADACGDACCAPQSPAGASLAGRARAALRYAFVDLFDDIFGWVLVGIIAAAVIHQWLAPETLRSILGGPFQSMLVMMLIGIPLYVCAETSTPVAAALLASGMNPGAALVLLLVGPATNLGSIGALGRELGRRTIVVYLATIAVVALLMGGWLNAIVDRAALPLSVRVLAEPLVPAWLKVVGAVAFLLLGVGTIVRRRTVARLAEWLTRSTGVSISARGVITAASVLAVGWYAASGLFIVNAGEIGIVRRFGAIQRPDLAPGWYYAFPYPIEQVDRVPAPRVRRLLLGSAAASAGQSGQSESTISWSLVGDENIVDIQMSVHWSADSDHVVRYRFGVVDPERLVRVTTLAAAREVLAGYSINRIFTADRLAAQRQIEHMVQERLAAYHSGIEINSFEFLGSHAPAAVHQAFRDVAGPWKTGPGRSTKRARTRLS